MHLRKVTIKSDALLSIIGPTAPEQQQSQAVNMTPQPGMKPFCTQHHTKMESNSADDWHSMEFRQKVLSQMYVLVLSWRQIAFVKQRVSFVVWLCQQTVI